MLHIPAIAEVANTLGWAPAKPSPPCHYLAEVAASRITVRPR